MNITLAPGPYCQSCSMPMRRPEDHGTNADGTLNDEYCHFCYRDGNFINPDATMEEVIEMSVNAMRKLHLPEALIEQTRHFIPMLKRWKKN